MTRQHFEAIANTLAATRPQLAATRPAARQLAYNAAFAQWAHTVRELARTLAQFNAGFNNARFLAACGLES